MECDENGKDYYICEQMYQAPNEFRYIDSCPGNVSAAQPQGFCSSI